MENSSNSTNIHHDASTDSYAGWEIIIWIIGIFTTICLFNCVCQYMCKKNKESDEKTTTVPNPVHEESIC